MSDRPTPETDALVPQFLNGGEIPDVFAHCRKLERERDEAMADLEFRRGLYKVLEEANNRLRTANEEAVKLARTLKQERDEAMAIATAYKDYAQLLVDEINDMAVFASVHGWKSSRIEQGKLLRDKIKQLEAAK